MKKITETKQYSDKKPIDNRFYHKNETNSQNNGLRFDDDYANSLENGPQLTDEERDKRVKEALSELGYKVEEPNLEIIKLTAILSSEAPNMYLDEDGYYRTKEPNAPKCK